MESLYRKYRPLTFESVVGQQHIVSTLEHAVAEGRLSHAYLFCGPRGTGKTTMARILAKSLLCEGAEAARATGASGCMPDGSCPECEAIAAGTHPDVYELDAASRTGVDNVREEIINSVSFAPVRGAYKVYIIDEVHMLTTAAFNALLKTLEEPPSHVIFVLCTTDPQKILETILSRCQRFDFHRISNEDIVGRLRFICEQEGFAFDEEALEIVARHARGGMRDALSTLEQLSVFGDGSVRVDDARSLLGEVASTVLSEFARNIAARDTVALFGLVRAQADEGNDLMELTHDLVAHMRDVYTAAIAGAKAELFDGTPEEVAGLVEEARLFEGADRLARTLTVLDDAALEMRNASDPRLVLEIALTRLARPEGDLTLEALAERLARLEAQLAAGVPSGPMDAAQLAAAAGAHGGVPGVVPRAAAGAASTAASAAAPVHAPARSAVPGSNQAPRRAMTAPAGASQPTSVSSASVATNAGAPMSSRESGADGTTRVPVSSGSATAPTSGSVVQSEVRAAAPARPSTPGAPIVDAPAAGGYPAAQGAPATSANAPAPQERVAAQGAPAAPTSSPVPQERTTISADSQPEMAACAVTPPAADEGDLQRRWADAVKRITAAQPSRGGLLQSSRAVSDDGETLTIGFPKGSTFALKMITRPDSSQLVMPIVCQVFGKRSVTYVMEGAASVAPAPSAGSVTSVAPAPVPTSAAPAAPVPTQAPTPVSTQAPAPRAVPAQAPAPSAIPAPGVGVAPAHATSAGSSSDQVRIAPAAEPAQSVPAAGHVQVAAADGPAAQDASAPQGEAEPRVDQASGPTVLPEPDIEADRKAWEDEIPPYDDAFIASYEDEVEIPPFNAPAEAVPADLSPAVGGQKAESTSPVSMATDVHPNATTLSSPVVASVPTSPADAPSSAGVSAPSAKSNAHGSPQEAPAPAAEPIPATDSDAAADPKAVLENIWGNVIYK